MTRRFPSGSRNAAQWQTFVSVGPRKKAMSCSRRCPTAASKSSTSNVTDMPSGETGQSGFLSIANVPAPTSYSMQIGIWTDRRVWFQSQYTFVKGTGAAHVADGAANEGDLFDLHCSLVNQVISRNRGRTLLFARPLNSAAPACGRRLE
jgi:hypothetical protein